MKKNLMKLSFAVAALAGITLFSSCLDKDNNNNSKPQAGLFIMHAAPGQDGEDIYFNNSKATSSVFSYTYHATTGMTPNTYAIAFVNPVSGDDTLASVVDSLIGGSIYSAILYDSGSAVKMMFFKDQYEQAQSSGAAFLRFLQLSPIDDAVTINIAKTPFASGRHFADNVSQPDLATYQSLSGGQYNITALNGKGDTLGHIENAELGQGGYYTLYLDGYRNAPADSLDVQLRLAQSY